MACDRAPPAHCAAREKAQAGVTFRSGACPYLHSPEMTEEVQQRAQLVNTTRRKKTGEGGGCVLAVLRERFYGKASCHFNPCIGNVLQIILTC